MKQKTKNLVFIPKGLVYELIDKKNIPKKQDYLKEVESILSKTHKIRSSTLTLAETNLLTPEIPLIYSNALVRIGDFLVNQYNDPVAAMHYYRRALWYDEQNPTALAGLGLSQFKADHDCQKAITNIQVAINNYPIYQIYYEQLYLVYRKCEVDKKSMENLKKQYFTNFKKDLEKKNENRVF